MVVSDLVEEALPLEKVQGTVMEYDAIHDETWRGVHASCVCDLLHVTQARISEAARV